MNIVNIRVPSTERRRKSNNYPRLLKANWPDNRSSAPGCRRGKRNAVTLSHSHTLALSIAMPRTRSRSALNKMNGEAATATVNVSPPPPCARMFISRDQKQESHLRSPQWRRIIINKIRTEKHWSVARIGLMWRRVGTYVPPCVQGGSALLNSEARE